MRTLAGNLLMLGAALAPAPLLAQSGPSRSVDDYVCAFTDECGEEAQAATSERKGRTSSTRGFSLSRPAPAPSASKPSGSASTPAARQSRVIGQAAAASKSKIKRAAVTRPAAASAKRRVDLRLTFETGSAVMTDQAKQEARVFAEALRVPKLAERKFVIEGHTDSVGGRAYNLQLSRQRAQAVADYLASLGVSRSRLRTVGYGFDRPIDGRSARAEENRRVEAVLES